MGNTTRSGRNKNVADKRTNGGGGVDPAAKRNKGTTAEKEMNPKDALHKNALSAVKGSDEKESEDSNEENEVDSEDTDPLPDWYSKNEKGAAEEEGVSELGEDNEHEIAVEDSGNEENHRNLAADEIKKKNSGVKYEMPAGTLKLLKDVLKMKLFAEVKFADQLDLRERAIDIGVKDLKFRESKIAAYVPCLIKKIKTETAILRCSIIRSIKAKFEGKQKRVNERIIKHTVNLTRKPCDIRFLAQVLLKN